MQRLTNGEEGELSDQLTICSPMNPSPIQMPVPCVDLRQQKRREIKRSLKTRTDDIALMNSK